MYVQHRRTGELRSAVGSTWRWPDFESSGVSQLTPGGFMLPGQAFGVYGSFIRTETFLPEGRVGHGTQEVNKCHLSENVEI